MKQTIKTFLLVAFLGLPASAWAQFDRSDDMGLWSTVGAERELSRKLTVGMEAECRLRNDMKTQERWSLELNGAYQLGKYVKLGAGYKFIRDNRRDSWEFHDPEETDLQEFRPAYWVTKHRLYLDGTGKLKVNHWEFSLRERVEYTYRPEHTAQHYYYDDDQWVTETESGEGEYELRSRFQVKYGKEGCPWKPHASMEFYNDWDLDKIRYTVGVDYSLAKRHTLGAFYRFVNERDRDPGETDDPNEHVIGLSYKIKL